MKTIVKRILSKTPQFFKKLRTLAYGVFVSGAAVLAANEELSLNLAPMAITIISYIIAVSAGVAGTSHLPKEKE